MISSPYAVRQILHMDKGMLIGQYARTEQRECFPVYQTPSVQKIPQSQHDGCVLQHRIQRNNWFGDLKISRHHEFDQCRNTFPVISIDLRVGTPADFDEYVDQVQSGGKVDPPLPEPHVTASRHTAQATDNRFSISGLHGDVFIPESTLIHRWYA